MNINEPPVGMTKAQRSEYSERYKAIADMEAHGEAVRARLRAEKGSSATTEARRT